MSDKLITVSGAQTLYKDTRDRIEEVKEDLGTKVGYATVEDGYLILKASEDSVEEIAKLTGFGGGGGGGGGSNPAILEVKNETPWGSNTSISNSEETCEVSLYWKSMEGEQDTGDGTLVIKTATQTLRTSSVKQGIVSVNVREFLATGDNTLYFTISDVYGNSRTLRFTITVTVYYLESVFNDSRTFYDTGNINFSYKPVGSGVKHMVFELDGEIIGELDTVTSNETEFFMITPEMWQTHGAHKLEAYFFDENGSKSNSVKFTLICAKTGDNTPIIATPFDTTTVKRYDTIDIPFRIYNPTSITSTVYLTVNGNTDVRTDIENNSEQHWTYRVMNTSPITMSLNVGVTTLTFDLTVSGSIVPVDPAINPALYLTSSGRDNASTDKDIWEYEDIQAEFDKVTFTPGVDGWVIDKDGYVALTVKGEGKVYIPYLMFKNNCTTDGKTIEFEFSTSDVNDYTATVIECMYNERGIRITAQDVIFKGEQTSLFTQFKEDEHVRIAFVVNAENDNRLLACYINGILSGVVEYKAKEDFSQANPVGITIGSTEVTTNVYNIRVYDRALSRREILYNWICDKQDADEMLAAYKHNDVFNDLKEIDIANLPLDLPYMVVLPQRVDGSHELSQKKDDKIPCDGYYVDPLHPEKNFTFTAAEMAVQGTSSAGYPRKNYKIKFKKGKNALDRPNFSWKDKDGNNIKTWAMNDQAVPTHTFTFKADFASSEGANNVELVRIYNDAFKNAYKTPPQSYSEDAPEEEKAEKDKIRVGIDGFPIVMFYNDGNKVTFLGKYNFNNDKGTEDVYGFKEGDQSWEMTSNVSYLALWKDDDFDTIIATTPEIKRKWTEAFEDRYPDAGNKADTSDLHIISTWLKSTDCGNILRVEKDETTGGDILVDTGIPIWADESKTTIDPETGEPVYEGFELSEDVTYGDKTYHYDNGEYRLAKYRNELENYFDLNSALFYYLFTELFLMVDSRAKNAFPTKFSEDGKWTWLPYDFDTALGINNEGKLTFGYNLEDIDQVDGADVFNGQLSVMWCNLRKAFPAELEKMYQNFNAWGINYDNIERRFENHQSKWPEAIFNEDAYFKYIQPYLEDGEDFLEMCLGSKEQQRKWWLYNRFRYIDSKYRAGESNEARIRFRAYSNSELNIIPYADIYARFKMGGKDDSPYAMVRAPKNEVATLRVTPGDKLDDLDCYIYSADQLKDIGDLSGFTPSTIILSQATKLQTLKVGREIPNEKLTTLTLGNNTLLKSINCINCPKLPSLTATNCTNLEELYLEGCSSLLSVDLPTGGMMTTLHLPANMQKLEIVNQTKITDFQLEGYSKLTTLVLNTVSQEVQRDTLTILHNMPDGSRVQLYNIDTEFNSVSEFEDFIADLNRMKSYDGTGPQEFIAQVIGKATIKSEEVVDYEYIAQVNSRYTNLDIICNTRKTVNFYNENGSEIVQSFYPVAQSHFPSMVTYSGAEPVREDTDTIHYVFDGWSTSFGGELIYTTNEIQGIVTSLDLYPHFEEIPIYTVNFLNYDGTLLEKTTTRPDLGNTVTYSEAFPTAPSGFTAPFIGWGNTMYAGVDIEAEENRTLINVTESFDIYAQMDWEIKPNTIEYTIDEEVFKRNYYAGQSFNPEGVSVSVEKEIPGGTIRVPALFTYDTTPFEPTNNLSISLIVDANNVANVPLGMAVTLTMTTPPHKAYQETYPEPVDFSGMSFTTTFSNGETEEVTEELEYNPGDFNETEGVKTITFVYHNVTCDYVVYVLNGSLTNIETLSWGLISRLVDAGQARSLWNIGDTKTVYINSGASSSRKSGIHIFRIVAFDHNIRGSIHNDEVFDMGDDHTYEYPEGKHTVTFAMDQANVPLSLPYIFFNTYEELIYKTSQSQYIDVHEEDEDGNPIDYQIANPDYVAKSQDTIYFVYEDENLGIQNSMYVWNGTEFVVTDKLLPVVADFNGNKALMPWVTDSKWNIHWDGTEGGGCPGQGSVHDYIQYFPQDLRDAIKTVTKGQIDYEFDSRPTDTARRYANKLTTQEEKLFIPSAYEIFGYSNNIINSSNPVGVDESKVCSRFDYYALNDSSVVTYGDYELNVRQHAVDTLAYFNDETPASFSSWYTRSFLYARGAAESSSLAGSVMYYVSCVTPTGILNNDEMSVRAADNRGYMICFNV